MLFGTKAKFALECEIQNITPEKYVFGNICFWASNKQIGDFNTTVILYSITEFLRNTLSHQNLRKDSALLNLPKEKIIEAIDAALFGSPNETDTLPYLQEQWDKYHSFCICPNGCEAFDGEFAVLVETQNEATFIWKDYYDKYVYDIILGAGEYEFIINQFLQWYDKKTSLRNP